MKRPARNHQHDALVDRVAAAAAAIGLDATVEVGVQDPRRGRIDIVIGACATPTLIIEVKTLINGLGQLDAAWTQARRYSVPLGCPFLIAHGQMSPVAGPALSWLRSIDAVCGVDEVEADPRRWLIRHRGVVDIPPALPSYLLNRSASAASRAAAVAFADGKTNHYYGHSLGALAGQTLRTAGWHPSEIARVLADPKQAAA